MTSDQMCGDVTDLLASGVCVLQGKVPKDSSIIHRRNSYTPLSSHDQVKRPRLYSAGNQPWLPLAPTPAALMPEGRQSQVRAPPPPPPPTPPPTCPAAFLSAGLVLVVLVESIVLVLPARLLVLLGFSFSFPLMCRTS